MNGNMNALQRAHRSLSLFADTRYVGQDYALTVALPAARLDTRAMTRFVEERG